MKVYIVSATNNDGYSFSKPFTSKKQAEKAKRLIDKDESYGGASIFIAHFPISKEGILSAIDWGNDWGVHYAPYLDDL